MDIQIVGKKKIKRKNVIASEFRLDVGAQSGEVNQKKEKQATDDQKLFHSFKLGQ